MKSIQLYPIPIVYMLVYIVVLLVTGVWLFLLSQGLSTTEFFETFTKIVQNPETKSLHGFIEIATPHLFAIGTLIFIVTHFMLFSTKVSKKFSLKVSMTLFSVALFNILSYLLISFGLLVSGWIKLVAMGLFVCVFIFVLGLLVFSL